MEVERYEKYFMIGTLVVILGAALLGARRRHIARSGPSMAILPTGGGLVLKGRF